MSKVMLDSTAIQKIIPHRYPMLFDRPGRRIGAGGNGGCQA